MAKKDETFIKIIDGTIDAIEEFIIQEEDSNYEVKKNANWIIDKLSREKLDVGSEYSIDDCTELVKELEPLRNHENFNDLVDQVRDFCDNPQNIDCMIEPDKPWPRE